MATVYSLICLGGSAGISVTASNSGGSLLLTATKHGAHTGQGARPHEVWVQAQVCVQAHDHVAWVWAGAGASASRCAAS